jgi:hypothetical protein
MPKISAFIDGLPPDNINMTTVELVHVKCLDSAENEDGENDVIAHIKTLSRPSL